MINIVEAYNACVAPNLDYVNPNGAGTPFSLQLQVGASVNRAQLDYLGKPWDIHYAIKPLPSLPERTYPSIGINAQFYNSNYQPRWYVGIGLWNKTVPLKGQSIFGTEAEIARGKYVEYRYHSHVIQFGIPIEIGHIFSVGAVKASLSLGGMLSYSRPSNLSRIGQEYLENEPIFEEKELYLFRKRSYFETSGFASFGIYYGKWGIKSYAISSFGLASPGSSVSLKNQAILVALTYQVTQSRGSF